MGKETKRVINIIITKLYGVYHVGYSKSLIQFLILSS